MIPRTRRPDTGWQTELRNAITRPEELLERLALPRSQWLPAACRAASTFPLRVPESFLRRMRPGDPHDPLLRQVLPLGDELQVAPGYRRDPVGDLSARCAPGLLQKYEGRALLIATGACAVHCRYCFRRHFPYGSEHAGGQNLLPALREIHARPGIEEVILSGGDPLMLDDRKLFALIDKIAQVPSVKRLRLHTRLPIVLPARVTPGFIQGLGNIRRLRTVMVVHANHAAELDHETGMALGLLHQAGITLYNQSVLLKGVNDCAAVLAELSERLFELNVQPYYLHQMDRVEGAAHFEVPLRRALKIYRQLQARLPGYIVPRFVREIEGSNAKTLINH